jgi:hypothetical protein
MATGQARVIFVIRHGEEPEVPPPYGIDAAGNQNVHSLLPRGWQRAGALATLFAPTGGQLRAGLAKPTELICPDYGDLTTTTLHRTYQTIQPLSRMPDVGDIQSPYRGARGDTRGAARSGHDRRDACVLGA